MRKAKIMHKSGTILHTIPVVSHKPHILCILRGQTADLLLEHAPEIAVLRKAAGSAIWLMLLSVSRIMAVAFCRRKWVRYSEKLMPVSLLKRRISSVSL